LGPRNVYKDMLNNNVSPIDHVVMNHQNQTNGIWGHVRYNIMFLNFHYKFNTALVQNIEIEEIFDICLYLQHCILTYLLFLLLS
jgi:hypothetical protein